MAAALATAAWAGTLVAVGWLAFSYLLPEDLSADNLRYGRLAAVAFLGRVFTFHTGLALAAATAYAVLARRWRLLTVAGLAAAATLGPTGYACRPRTPPTVAGPTLRVMSVNVCFQNTDDAAVVRAITTAAPDVVAVEEYTPEFDAALRPALSAAYPHQCCQPRVGGSGLAVFSRRPFVGDPRPDLGDFRAQIRCVVRLGDRPVAVYAVHPKAPLNTGYILRNRRQTLDYVAQVKAEPLPAILAGDWNFTAETANAVALGRAGLTDCFDVAGRGRGTTWPMNSGWASWPPGIRLDHVYLTPQLTCTRYQTGGFDGSDHLPIVTDIGFRG